MNACENGGTCTDRTDRTDSFTCLCPTGYGGLRRRCHTQLIDSLTLTGKLSCMPAMVRGLLFSVRWQSPFDDENEDGN